MSVIVLDQGMVHYETLGRGRPLIFLHGWVGSWRYWIPCMQTASITCRTYALDLWGFGDTDKNNQRYTIDQQCALIDGFINEMGIGRLALVGHGLGAVAAVEYALSHSEAVDRLMLVGYPIANSQVSPKLKSLAPQELADWLLTRAQTMEAARGDAPKADSQAIRVSLEHIQRLNLKDMISRLQVPCLLVHGQNDPAVELPRDDHLFDTSEQIHQIVFEQSGHFPMLDDDNKFNRLLKDFLSLASGESPRDLQLKEEWKRRVR